MTQDYDPTQKVDHIKKGTTKGREASSRTPGTTARPYPGRKSKPPAHEWKLSKHFFKKMAIISKDGYAAKAAYAARVARENVESMMEAGLDESTAEEIAHLGSLRHDLHCMDWADAMWCTESADYDTLTRLVANPCGDGEVIDLVRSIDMPDNISAELIGVLDRISTDLSSLDNDAYCTDESGEEVKSDRYDTDEEYQEAYDDARTRAGEVAYRCASDCNSAIEAFLKKVDEKYGTDYCPTGLSRRF